MQEVAQNSDVVFTIVGFPSDVEAVLLGQDGVVSHIQPGSIIVDMTTSQPSLAQRIAQEASKKGVHAIDAPVSGGDVGAKNATLSVMVPYSSKPVMFHPFLNLYALQVGGDKNAVDRVNPLFQAMGKNINYLGGAGLGQHTKMVNQILISTMMIGVVEGLLYGYKAGLNLEQVIAAVGSGAAGSWSINNYGPRMIKRNFDPGFFVEHFVKDLEIALDEARRMQLCLPGTGST